MSYWKCQSAKISEDGREVEMSFKDANGVSQLTMNMSAEEWKNIMIYKSAHDEPERRMLEAHKRITDYFVNEVRRGIKEQAE